MAKSASILQQTHLYYVIRTDHEGNYTYVNNFFKERFSFLAKNGEFIGTSSLDSIAPEDHQICINVSLNCLQTPNVAYPVILRKPRGKDDFFWTQWEFMATYIDEQEEKLEIICVGYDITESEALRRRASASTRELELLLDHISDGFLQVDGDWKVIRGNQTFEEVFLQRNDELRIGKSIWSFFSDSEHYPHSKAVRKAMIEQQEVRFEEYFKDRKRWYAFQIYPTGGGIAIFVQDISVRKAQMKEILEQNQRLKEIAYLQSHVVRAPLANMLGLLELLKEQGLTGDAKKYVLLMVQAGQKLDNVIHEIVYNATQLELEDEEIADRETTH